MIISPKTAIEEGWIVGIKHDDQIQPNAIDFTVDRVYKPMDGFSFSVYEKIVDDRLITTKTMQRWEPLELDSNFWHLDIGCYDSLSDVYLELPEGIACLPVMQRSTFNRNGVTISSGVYDSGYKGHVGFMIHNPYFPCQIAQGTRIGQIMFVESQKAGLYAGGYNHEQGTSAEQHEE